MLTPTITKAIVAGAIILSIILIAKIFKGVTRIISIGILVVAIASIVTSSGCGRRMTSTDIAQSVTSDKGEVVLADGSTVSFFDDVNGSTYTIERDTEYENKINELNEKQEQTGEEQQVYESLVAMYTNLGINGETTYSKKEYTSEDSYVIYGHNTDTNLVVSADVTPDGIKVYEDGPENGSEYIVLKGVSKLNGNLNAVEDILYNFGIYSDNIAQIVSVDESDVVIDVDGTLYTVNTELRTLTVGDGLEIYEDTEM